MNITSAPGLARVGIDDCGNGEVVGWAAVCLDPVTASGFERDADQLRRKARIKEFKGNKFRGPRWYREFLEILKQHALNACLGGCVVEFWSRSYMLEVAGRAVQIAAGGLGQLASQTTDGEREATAEEFQPLWWLVDRWWPTDKPRPMFAGASSLQVEVDESQHTLRIPQFVRVPCEATPLGSNVVPFYRPQELLRLLCNAYTSKLQEKAKRAPTLRQVTFVDSSSSMLVQAADVVANFALNDLQYMVDPSSLGKTAFEKVALFRAVFPQAMPYDVGHLDVRDGRLVCECSKKITRLHLVETQIQSRGRIRN